MKGLTFEPAHEFPEMMNLYAVDWLKEVMDSDPKLTYFGSDLVLHALNSLSCH
jgi:hypothetical protein